MAQSHLPRTVQFTSYDFHEVTGAGTHTLLGPGPDVQIQSTTTVNVYSYLYIYGNSFGSTSNVFGWGAGAGDSGWTDMHVYHNEGLVITASGFANPEIAVSPPFASHKDDIDMLIGLKATNESNEDLLLDAPAGIKVMLDNGTLPVGDLNGLSVFMVPNETDGHLILKIHRRLEVQPTNGPGVYSNTGTVNIDRI
jgi:hypothetical protein